MELSPGGRRGLGVHALAISGPLQKAGAVLLAFSRNTRWALSILGCYVFLVSVFGGLPRIFNPDAVRGFEAGGCPAPIRRNLHVPCQNPASALPVN